MPLPAEDPSLTLLRPAPEEKLQAWLQEFFGKTVEITERELLRHRDLSYVERLCVKDALPESLIYKQVLPPWDIEQDLHERILIPSIANSPQLYMTAHHGHLTVMLLEDLGKICLKEQADGKTARRLGEELARMHRAYQYRIDEIIQMNVLRSLTPIDFEEFILNLVSRLVEWQDLDSDQARLFSQSARQIAHRLAGEPITLTHGDLYAENIIMRSYRLFIIDWSWFTMISVPTIDLATITSNHFKNGKLREFSDVLLEAYSFESGRKTDDVASVLPYASVLERILFLNWAAERKSRGIFGTTIGPVEKLIAMVADDIARGCRSFR